MFPSADDAVLDLIQSCLIVRSENRISAKGGLRHPYVAAFHDPDDELGCDHIIRIPIDDNVKLTVQDYRERLYDEVLRKREEQCQADFPNSFTTELLQQEQERALRQEQEWNQQQHEQNIRQEHERTMRQEYERSSKRQKQRQRSTSPSPASIDRLAPLGVSSRTALHSAQHSSPGNSGRTNSSSGGRQAYGHSRANQSHGQPRTALRPLPSAHSGHHDGHKAQAERHTTYASRRHLRHQQENVVPVQPMHRNHSAQHLHRLFPQEPRLYNSSGKGLRGIPSHGNNLQDTRLNIQLQPPNSNLHDFWQ